MAFVLAMGLAVPTLLACQPQRPPQREVFDEAEDAYRRGHYDRALERYEVFLKNNPDHQLAPLAQQRIMSIERELEVVMGRKNGPRPIYLRPVVPGVEPESATLQSRSP